MSNEATMPQDISDREDFYKDSSNKYQKSSGNKSFSELLSPSDYQGSTATTPSGRDNKNGWYDIHQKHVNLPLNSKTILVLIGDSIVAGLSCCANIWRTFFKTFHTLNYGIGRDRTQHVLWRAENATLPNSLKYVVIHCGTNNIDRYQPRDIANGVISIGLKLQEKCCGLKVIVTGVLPRDSEWSQRRKKINSINYYLEKLCCDRFDDFYFMKQDNDWTDKDGKLDKKLYYADQLHLVEAGNRKFACSILKILSKLMQDQKLGNSSDGRKAHYLFEFNSDVNRCKPVSDNKPVPRKPVSSVCKPVPCKSVLSACKPVTRKPVSSVCIPVPRKSVLPLSKLVSSVCKPVPCKSALSVCKPVTRNPVSSVCNPVPRKPVSPLSKLITRKPSSFVCKPVTRKPVSSVCNPIPRKPVSPLSKLITRKPSSFVCKPVSRKHVSSIFSSNVHCSKPVSSSNVRNCKPVSSSSNVSPSKSVRSNTCNCSIKYRRNFLSLFLFVSALFGEFLLLGILVNNNFSFSSNNSFYNNTNFLSNNNFYNNTDFLYKTRSNILHNKHQNFLLSNCSYVFYTLLSFKPSYVLNKFIDFTNFVNLFFDIYHYWKTLSNIRNFTESLFPITFFAIFGIFVLKRLTQCSNYKSAKITKLKSDTFYGYLTLALMCKVLDLVLFHYFNIFQTFVFICLKTL